MCDTFCIRRPGGMLFAKNSDRPVAEPQVVETLPRRHGTGTLDTQYLAIADAGARSTLIGSRPTWLWGLEHGVGAQRLAVGNEKIWTTDDAHAAQPALLGMDLVRLALERGADADEALESLTGLLGEHGQGGSGEEHAQEPYFSSFLIVDPCGGWMVETSGRSWVAAPVGDGAAISNRVSLRTEWTRSSPGITPGTDWDAWRDPAAPTGIADHRLAATRACVARGGEAIGARQAVAALRDHGTGPWGMPGEPSPASPPAPPADIGDDWSGITVCMHVRDYQATTASMVAWLPEDPAEPLRLWSALGSPCTSVYLPGVILGSGLDARAVVPEVLAEPSCWHDLASLARAVEAPGDEGLDALARIRAVLGPIENNAWAEADELAERHGASTIDDTPDRRAVDAWISAARRWSSELVVALDALSGRTG